MDVFIRALIFNEEGLVVGLVHCITCLLHFLQLLLLIGGLLLLLLHIRAFNSKVIQSLALFEIHLAVLGKTLSKLYRLSGAFYLTVPLSTFYYKAVLISGFSIL